MHLAAAYCCRRLMSGALIALLTTSISCARMPRQPAAMNARPIPLNATLVERSIAGGNAHVYTARFKAGQYGVIRIRQLAVDLVATLEDPAGIRIAEVD